MELQLDTEEFVIDLDEEGEEEDIEVVKKIGDVTCLAEIGRGAFAIVYRGIDSRGREYAVKEIPRKLLNEKLLESLRKEIGILKAIDHPNIVKLFSAKKTKSYFYLFMEFCAGGDLNKCLRKWGRFEEFTAQKVVFQVSQGLKALAERNIVHRDLKLSNFLIARESGQYVVKIADFGFARVLSKDQDAQTYCGTAPNMAPELLKGESYNEKADMWSMGVVIYRMLTGSYPYHGLTPLYNSYLK